MQFQSDILGTSVIRPVVTETTALGAAYLAGIAVGYWSGIEEVKSQWKAEKVFSPKMEEDRSSALKQGWKDAMERTLTD